MLAQTADRSLSQQEIIDFLSQTEPFCELSREELDHLAASSQVKGYATGCTILTRGKSKLTHLMLIMSGRVKLSMTSEDGQENVFSIRKKGQSIGVLGILRQSLSNLDAVALEETVCLLLSRDDFSHLIQTNPGIAQYYIKVLGDGYVNVALNQLQRKPQGHTGTGSMLLFGAQVGDASRRRPEMIPGGSSIKEAAELMYQAGTDNILVTGPEGRPQGIITDRDLRRVVAQGVNYADPVSSIMSSPLRTIPDHMICFDGLLEMMRQRLHHLVLEKNGEITGVLSASDLMIMQGSSPLQLVREINQAQEIEDLYDLALRSPRIMHGLILEGAKPANITRLITLINDHILERLLTLLEMQLGGPPAPYCWLYMGSEGRQEQTFMTDQDNGILYADPADEQEAEKCRLYFKALGNEATRHLVNCGFPRCKGDIMASNPKWCQPLKTWKGYFDHWIGVPEPQEVLNATIFFDFRPGYGAAELGDELHAHLIRAVKGQEVFLRFLAQDCLTTPSAIGLFKRFVLEREGEHKNRLDLKTKGLVPFVDFARILALRHSVPAANTLERLKAVTTAGHMSNDLYQKCSQAYEIQMELRLIHQDGQWAEGLEPDNFIDPEQLGELERKNLKDALAVVGEIKSYLKDSFHLGA